MDSNRDPTLQQSKAAMLTRREFTYCASAGLFSAACARSLPADEPKNSLPGKFFDFHTHIGQLTNYTAALSVEELLRWMDAHDISQACVLPLVSPESTTFALSTEVVLEQTKPYRDRLIPFCSFDPRTDYSGGPRGLLGILKRYAEAGARGFGEQKAGVPIDDPRNMRLYHCCAELKLPVLMHIDNSRNMDKPGLPGLAKVLAEFPTVNFLGHAHGWWASLSGGVTQEDLGRSPVQAPVQPGGAIDVLMDKHPNLYGDLSASSGVAAISRDMKFGREFIIRRADRLVFGTDFHLPGQTVKQFELYERLNLPSDVANKVFRQNARRLLNLS